ncbi:MAG: 1-deoxy-D-xylulose-5-phosphate synthase [Bacteroides sp.]|nr:1-deoxy-D-xylulose-5-phosphate synthase [Eubacterium sp.]MCM1418944.1 1-deoxy-D-xylulose-5-phosphate synthase [Roseburia sp.]MCM1462112.1 1-deoxy-D-xylulose-5-phosphate synthase [Bacteroides sp.]
MALENLSSRAVGEMDLAARKALCTEIRNFLIDSIPRTGGHLASNLGTVELTVALHSVFTTPEDKILFDVGHQSYTHKIITGRYKDFAALRSEGGISGFPRAEESEHDAFIGGHSSISVSAALGIAKAMELQGKAGNVIAVIGDGALTGGEAYEGLNNVGKLASNLIIVLNDNQMSISKNRGVIADYLTKMRSSKSYFDKKEAVKDFLARSAIGQDISKSISGTKDLIKFAIYQSNIFEALGFKYLGPVNGHNVEKLIEAFTVAKLTNEPCIVHVKTKKGKGFAPAEENSGEYHGVSKPAPPRAALSYSEVMGRELLRLGGEDRRICAVSAAMKYATGLQHFAKAYPERFFDVGIAEQHALTFSCGLASQGMIPVFAVYSTFLQRCYDQILHDASIERKHLVLCVDRAGFVGEDGETHQGLFDVSMLSAAPGIRIYSPWDAAGLVFSLRRAILEDRGVSVVRYPRGVSHSLGTKGYRDFDHSGKKHERIAVSYGRLCGNFSDFARCDTLRLNRIAPIPEEVVDLLACYKKIFFYEEGIRSGGIGEHLLYLLNRAGYRGEYEITAVEDQFVGAAECESQLRKYGMDRASIAGRVDHEE